MVQSGNYCHCGSMIARQSAHSWSFTKSEFALCLLGVNLASTGEASAGAVGVAVGRCLLRPQHTLLWRCWSLLLGRIASCTTHHARVALLMLGTMIGLQEWLAAKATCRKLQLYLLPLCQLSPHMPYLHVPEQALLPDVASCLSDQPATCQCTLWAVGTRASLCFFHNILTPVHNNCQQHFPYAPHLPAVHFLLYTAHSCCSGLLPMFGMK